MPYPTLDLQQLIDDAVAQGLHSVELPGGIYDLVRPAVIPAAFAVRAPSPVAYGDFTSCRLRGQGGWPFCIHLQGQASYIEGVAVDAVDRDGPLPLVGIYISGHSAEAYGCSAHWMRDFGFYVHGTSGENTNANGFGLDHCRAARCGKAGFYVNGAETNAGQIRLCDASGNFGYGFFDSPFLNVTYSACHASNNPLGNYAQGGTLETPLDGGTACYSKFEGCYSEAPGGGKLCQFRSAQVRIDGGNLARYARGWQAQDGSYPPFPGSIGGTDAHELFDREGVTVEVPAGPGHAISARLGAGQKFWQVLKSWVGSPSWLADCVALLRYDKTGWLVPYAATSAQHPAGPGRRVHATSLVSTPHDFALRKVVQLTPLASVHVTFDSSLLLPSAGGYLGTLVLHAPGIEKSIGTPDVDAGPWERVDTNTIRVKLVTGPWLLEMDQYDAEAPFEVAVSLVGVRAEQV